MCSLVRQAGSVLWALFVHFLHMLSDPASWMCAACSPRALLTYTLWKLTSCASYMCSRIRQAWCLLKTLVVLYALWELSLCTSYMSCPSYLWSLILQDLALLALCSLIRQAVYVLKTPVVRLRHMPSGTALLRPRNDYMSHDLKWFGSFSFLFATANSCKYTCSTLLLH